MKDLADKFKKEREEEKKKHIMEEERKLKALEEKKSKINNEFKNEVDKIKSLKIKAIEEELKRVEKTFCMEEIQKFDTKKIRELIIEIFKSNKIVNFIYNNLKIYSDKNKNNIKSTEHLNIILVGPCGVGKSTLINAILELEEQTYTRFGMPITMDIEFHVSNKITFLRLADSRGIEKTQESGEKLCKQIESFIKKQLETKDPDKFIHCIWYCWTGSRLESSEIDVLKKLSKQYSLKTLPVIIVYTNAFDPDQVKEAELYIKERLKLNNAFIPVLAKVRDFGIYGSSIIIKPFNLDKLIDTSFELAKSAVEPPCYQGLIEDIKKTIREKINILTNKVKGSIDIDVKNILSQMNLDSKIEDLYKDNTNIILNICYKYIFLDEKIKIEDINNPNILIDDVDFSISKDSQISIKKFVTDYFERILESYKNNLSELLKKYSEELSNEIMEFQIQYNDKHENLLITPWTLKQLKETSNLFIFKNISKKAELIVLKNAFNFIINPLIKNFEDLFILLYNKAMEGDKIKKYLQTLIPYSLEHIEQKIKEYNESRNREVAPTPKDKISEDIDDLLSDL